MNAPPAAPPPEQPRPPAARDIFHAHLMPVVELPYFHLLTAALREAGGRVVRASRLPRRGVYFSRPLDVVHLHMLDILFQRGSTLAALSRFFWFLFISVPVLRARRTRLVWTCHEVFSHEGPRTLARWFSSIIAAVADDIIVHNHAMRRLVLAEFSGARPARTHFIPHGSLSPYYAPRLPAASTLKPPATGATFAAIGYMRPNKGTDLIISAFRGLPCPDARLVVAGVCKDDAYFQKLLQLAADDPRIELTRGLLSDEAVVALHLSAHSIVFAFRDCPTSGSLITALSLGRHVIAPGLGHAKELLQTSESGIYEPDNPLAGLRREMTKIIQEPARALALGALASARIAQPDWPALAQATLSVYRSRPTPPPACI